MSCDLKGFLNNFFRPLFIDRPLMSSLALREGPAVGVVRAVQWAKKCEDEKRVRELISSSKAPVRAERFSTSTNPRKKETDWKEKAADVLYDFLRTIKGVPERRPWEPKGLRPKPRGIDEP